MFNDQLLILIFKIDNLMIEKKKEMIFLGSQ